MFLGQLVILIHACLLGTAIFPQAGTFLLGYYNMDPFHIYLEKYQTNFQGFFWLLRYFLLIFLPNWALVGTRTVLVVTFQTSLNFLNALLYLKNKFLLSRSSIILYKQLIIERNILTPYEVAQFTSYVPVTFAILIGCFNFILLGFKFNVQGEVLLVFFGIAVVTFGMTVSVYSIGCHLYFFSIKIVERWKRLLTIGIRVDVISARIMRRMIRALVPLSIPAGNVGILDRDFMLNFFSALLQYTVNLMVAIRELYS